MDEKKAYSRERLIVSRSTVDICLWISRDEGNRGHPPLASDMLNKLVSLGILGTSKGVEIKNYPSRSQGDPKVIWSFQAFSSQYRSQIDVMEVALESQVKFYPNNIEDIGLEGDLAGGPFWVLRLRARMVECHIQSFKILLKVLVSLAPQNTIAYYDETTGKCLSIERIRDFAELKSGLPADLVYQVHSCPMGHHRFWIKTLGLSRFGLPEVEFLDVSLSGLGRCSQLLASCAKLLVGDWYLEPFEFFWAGNDLLLQVVPWEQYLQSKSIPVDQSTVEFRAQQNELSPSYVIVGLLPVKEHTLEYEPVHIENCPVAMKTESHFFLSEYEQRWMKHVAQERLSDCIDLFKLNLKEGGGLHFQLCIQEKNQPGMVEKRFYDLVDIGDKMLKIRVSGTDELHPTQKWIPFSQVINWKVMTPSWTVTPLNVNQFFRENHLFHPKRLSA